MTPTTPVPYSNERLFLCLGAGFAKAVHSGRYLQRGVLGQCFFRAFEKSLLHLHKRLRKPGKMLFLHCHSLMLPIFVVCKRGGLSPSTLSTR